jgi:hypothetical protein
MVFDSLMVFENPSIMGNNYILLGFLTFFMVFGGARYRDSWVSLWFSCLLLHGAEILFVPNAAHVGSIIGAGTVFSSQIILRGHRRSASLTPLDLPLPILGGMPRTLRLASALAASWQCQWCNYTNNSAKNKRCCFLC